jgi:hypothetical protein
MTPQERDAYKRQMWALYQRQGRPDRQGRARTDDAASIALKINRALARGGYLGAIVAERFATGGATSGTVWASLKASTIKQRARQGYGPAPVLVRSGSLMRAASGGKETATSDGITLDFKDGPAPAYKGKGKAGKQQINNNARIANSMAKAFVGKSGALSDYAGALNKRRPFYAAPTEQELRPLLQARDAMIDAVVASIRDGHGVSRVTG